MTTTTTVPSSPITVLLRRLRPRHFLLSLPILGLFLFATSLVALLSLSLARSTDHNHPVKLYVRNAFQQSIHNRRSINQVNQSVDEVIYRCDPQGLPLQAVCGSNALCSAEGICVCNDRWITSEKHNRTLLPPCNYKQKSKLTAFLLAFFVGGVDWFYLSCGTAGYIVAGIFKILTVGGCGVWVLVDWIRVLTDAFPDGHHMPLFDDL